MYVRSKIAKGHTYYQIVEGVRDGKKVRQRVILAMGIFSDPAKAIAAWRRQLGRLQKWKIEFPDGCFGPSKMFARKTAAVDAEIGRLESRIATLGGILENDLVNLPHTRKKFTHVMALGRLFQSAIEYERFKADPGYAEAVEKERLRLESTPWPSEPCDMRLRGTCSVVPTRKRKAGAEKPK